VPATEAVRARGVDQPGELGQAPAAAACWPRPAAPRRRPGSARVSRVLAEHTEQAAASRFSPARRRVPDLSANRPRARPPASPGGGQPPRSPPAPRSSRCGGRRRRCSSAGDPRPLRPRAVCATQRVRPGPRPPRCTSGPPGPPAARSPRPGRHWYRRREQHARHVPAPGERQHPGTCSASPDGQVLAPPRSPATLALPFPGTWRIPSTRRSHPLSQLPRGEPAAPSRQTAKHRRQAPRRRSAREKTASTSTLASTATDRRGGGPGEQQAAPVDRRGERAERNRRYRKASSPGVLPGAGVGEAERGPPGRPPARNAASASAAPAASPRRGGPRPRGRQPAFLPMATHCHTAAHCRVSVIPRE